MNIDDLKKVKDFLYEIRRKWHDLGIELEVKAEELEVIEAQYSDLGVCLRKMLLVWLKNHLKPPTWEAIEAALESKAINELELAARAGRNLILLPCPMLLLLLVLLLPCHASPPPPPPPPPCSLCSAPSPGSLLSSVYTAFLLSVLSLLPDQIL